MYDPTKRRLSYKFFLNDFKFLLVLGLLVAIGLWVPFFIIGLNSENVAQTKANTTVLQNTFWHAVQDGHAGASNVNLDNFARSLQPYLKEAQANYASGKTVIPKKLTEAVTPHNAFGSLAFNYQTNVWGMDKANITGPPNPPNAFVEKGKFSPEFLSNIKTVASGTNLANKPIPSIPSPFIIPLWLYFAGFFIIGSAVYSIAAIDFEGRISFFSIARTNEAGKPGRIIVSFIALPVATVLWCKKWGETLYVKQQYRSLTKRLEASDNPLAEEAKAAKRIADKYRKSKHMHLDEVATAAQFAHATHHTLLDAKKHQEENDARQEALRDLEQLAPLAEAARDHHDTLERTYTAEAAPLMENLGKRFQKALGKGSDTDQSPGPNQDGGPLKPDVI